MHVDKRIDDLGLNLDEAPVSAEASVVNEKGEPLVHRDPRLELRKGASVDEVDRKRLALGPGLTPQPLGQQLQPVPPPCHQDEVVAILREALGICRANAR